MFDRIISIFYRPEFFRRQEFTTGQALSTLVCPPEVVL